MTPWVLAAVLIVTTPGCKPGAPHKTPPATQEAAAASQPTGPTTAPAAARPATQPTSLPASQPTSKPASRPASTYISKPPYPVNLYVLSPDEAQPGWLKILQLADAKTSATCTGLFPEQNVIEVQTNNVRQLRLHIGYLPLAARQRIVLRVDGQAIELAHKHRHFIVFERSATGQWRILRSED